MSGTETAGGTLHVEGTWEAPGPVGKFKVSGALGGRQEAVLVPEAESARRGLTLWRRKKKEETIMKHKLVFSSLLLALSLASAPTARAITTWYVDGVNGSDSNNCMSSPTACKTIGHAIALAHSDDSIMVAAATYKENLNIGFSLNVLGSGASTTIIDGGGVNTVMTVSNANAHVSLSKLTIQNGVATCSGGIYNIGTLAISNSAISANRAGRSGGGGICNRGTLTIYNSIISGNQANGSVEIFTHGGGIYNDGTLTIDKSTVSGNSLHFGEGGGLFNGGGTATINNSTISGNNGFLRGGGIDIGFGTVTINNSTISGNSAPSGHGGGIENIYGAATINNSTISGNTAWHSVGGIEGAATLQNSIVASNSPGNCSGSMTSKGYNMSSDGTCNLSNSGDRNNTDPKLGPLQNNGGPTLTMALPSGSPAVDAGNPSGCTDGSGHLLTTDQRGYPRHDPEDTSGCDMGAYERQTD